MNLGIAKWMGGAQAILAQVHVGVVHARRQFVLFGQFASS